MPKKITIMLAEDHNLFRATLVSYLKDIKDFDIIGDARNGVELLRLIRSQEPQIVITDIQMPLMNGFELGKIIKRDFPNVKVIFLSMHYSSIFAAEMITNGINSCLPKECEPEILIEAIRKVNKQGFYFNPKFNNLIVSQIFSDTKFEILKSQISLSHREIEVLKLICDGKTNKAIAEILDITPAGVDFHRQSIYNKTDLSSVALLVKYAIKNGLVSVS